MTMIIVMIMLMMNMVEMKKVIMETRLAMMMQKVNIKDQKP